MTTTERSLYAEDAAEQLRRWDAGETIWSLSMGGLGPGYEQAIQVAAIEMTRDGIGFTRTGDEESDWKAWDALCTESLKRVDGELGGLTGAMYGAAKWLAYQWCCNGGPADLMKRAKERPDGPERCIQVSKSFPKA